MGVVLAFPSWGVICREESSTRGEPRDIVDPKGFRHEVLGVLRRRLIASREPGAPIRHEFEVRTDVGDFRVTWTDPPHRWTVEPLEM